MQGGIKGGNLGYQKQYDLIDIHVMTELYNKTSEREKRRSLRNNMPPAEKIVWERLRNRQVEGCKFRRQYSIDVFVVDFYATELKLAIEIDGDSHFQDGAQVYDYERQSFLESTGSLPIAEDYPSLTLPFARGGNLISIFPALQCRTQSNFPPFQGGIKGGNLIYKQVIYR